jgi:hypothetical protein
MTPVRDLAPLPAFAAWRFVDAVDGFEVVFCEARLLRGYTSAIEGGRPYAVRYQIILDENWRTREVHVSSATVDGRRSAVLVADGHGHWTVDGVEAPHLDGLLDVDLEASACTNTLPIHRLALPDDEVVPASAAYVRALDLSVTRLDQTYRRVGDRRFDYSSDSGAFRAVLEYDDAGLIVDYPGIAVRFA